MLSAIVSRTLPYTDIRGNKILKGLEDHNGCCGIYTASMNFEKQACL
jgi:hypothetical protein